MEKLENFLQQAVGLQYGLNVRDVLMRRTTKGRCSMMSSIKQDPSDCDQTFIEEGRRFFCSELIAKAYKILGVIENDSTPCSKYFPYHFSEKGSKNFKM